MPDTTHPSDSKKPAGVVSRPIVKFLDGTLRAVDDDMALEEPLEIVIGGLPYAVTMRLPGDDVHLGAGFCLSEGLIGTAADVASIETCPHDPNKLRIELAPGNGPRPLDKREGGFLSKSSCGLCGRDSLDEVFTDIAPVPRTQVLTASDILRFKSDFETRKQVFPLTGGTHSAAVYSRDGECLAFAEDVGRHNCLDKAAGQVLLKDTRDRAVLALVSSRLSFEMVQKAAALGVEILAGVSAATTLALEYAAAYNLTLIGFLRRGRMNVYSGMERIQDGG